MREKRRLQSTLCFGLIFADVLAYGIHRMPQHAEDSASCESICMEIGGGAANSAIAFARLGRPVSLVGRVGGDAFGEAVLRRLREDGVDTAYIRRSEDCSTGVAMGFVSTDGERSFLTAGGANLRLGRDDIPPLDEEEPALLFVNGYFKFPQMEEQMPELLDTYRNALTAFDLASWDPTERWYESIRPFISRIDYFFANSAQLERLTGHEAPDRAARFLLEEGAGAVVAKLGADGCTYYSAGERIHCGGVPVEVVDTTGAGDSFDAAFLTGVLEGWEVLDCCRFANTVAAINCTGRGANRSIPDRHGALDAMVRRYGQPSPQACEPT